MTAQEQVRTAVHTERVRDEWAAQRVHVYQTLNEQLDYDPAADKYECPMCGGMTLSVHDGDSQPVVLNCFLNCEEGEILAEVGLSWMDISTKPSQDVPQDVPQDVVQDYVLQLPHFLTAAARRCDWETLAAATAAGDLSPIDVLGDPPTDRLRGCWPLKAAKELQTLFSLRWGGGDPRPIPVSQRFLGERIGCDQRKAGTALGRLVYLEYVVDADRLKPRASNRRGTKLLAPPPARHERIRELVEARVNVEAGTS